MKARSARLAALAVVLSGGAACGGGQTQGAAFDRHRHDDGATMATLAKQLAAVPIPIGADVAVGTFGERSLVGISLAGGKPWTFQHPIACRPVVAGGIVIGLGADEMFGLDAKTGNLLWTRKAAGCLRGAADDGKITVVSAQPIAGPGGIVLAISRDGQVVRQIEDTSNIGEPAILDGFVFLPWNARYVSAYDLSLGQEVARVRFSERVTRAFASGGALFFGERALTRFDEGIALAPEGKAATAALPPRILPSHPAWMRSGHESSPPRALPADKARLYARPAARGAPGIEGGRYAATHGRVALGLDARDGALVWARTNGAPFLGGAAYKGGFALCDADGRVALLDAQTGAEAGSASLGIPVDACVVQADGLTVTKAAARPLRDEVAEALRLSQEDAAPIQRFLLRELAEMPDERATETLIDLVSSGAVSAEMAPHLRAALAARRSGATFMLTALSKRPDFLEGATARAPIGPLAEALAAMKETRAAPLLAEHLLDPDAPAVDVERAAAALEVLAGPAEVAALRSFFALYRSEPAEGAIVLAVAHVAAGLVRLGAGDVVVEAQGDAFTSEAVRSKIAGIAGLTGGAEKAPAR